MTFPARNAVLDTLTPDDRLRVEALLSKQWSQPGEHPLSSLHGESLGDFRLLALLGPKNNVGSRYFQLLLANCDGRLAEEPLALGLHNTGAFPAYNWIELTQYRAVQRFAGVLLDLAPNGFDLALFEMLSQFAPAGGHMMVEYDSPSQQATERVLTLGYPQVTSPLGYLMFRVGCRSYRDWYISEGGREGPRKLQGFKPRSDEINWEKTSLLRDQLEQFLSRSRAQDHGQWGVLARRNAQAVLQALSVA